MASHLPELEEESEKESKNKKILSGNTYRVFKTFFCFNSTFFHSSNNLKSAKSKKPVFNRRNTCNNMFDELLAKADSTDSSDQGLLF